MTFPCFPSSVKHRNWSFLSYQTDVYEPYLYVSKVSTVLMFYVKPDVCESVTNVEIWKNNVVCVKHLWLCPGDLHQTSEGFNPERSDHGPVLPRNPSGAASVIHRATFPSPQTDEWSMRRAEGQTRGLLWEGWCWDETPPPSQQASDCGLQRTPWRFLIFLKNRGPYPNLELHSSFSFSYDSNVWNPAHGSEPERAGLGYFKWFY